MSSRVHGDVRREDGVPTWEPVYVWARRIPAGLVMTYGQIAGLLENPTSPRAVGWALHRCPEDVPWQRVVNASGGMSTDRLPDLPGGLQRAMLESEGIEFRKNGTLDLEIFRWHPHDQAQKK